VPVYLLARLILYKDGVWGQSQQALDSGSSCVGHGRIMAPLVLAEVTQHVFNTLHITCCPVKPMQPLEGLPAITLQPVLQLVPDVTPGAELDIATVDVMDSLPA